jgi:hypothetical protein
LTEFIEIRNIYHPVKRGQALWGSNLPRDSRMQVALNNAPERNSERFLLFPSSPISLFKPSCPCLKKPNKISARSASFFFLVVAYFKNGILQFTLNQDTNRYHKSSIAHRQFGSGLAGLGFNFVLFCNFV